MRRVLEICGCMTLDSYRKCSGGHDLTGASHGRRGTFDKSVRSEPLVRRAGCLYLWVLNGVCVRNPRGRAQGLRQEGEEWSAQSGSKGEKHGLDGVIPALLAAAHTLRVGVREGTREVRH
jgi:hypothetical protein